MPSDGAGAVVPSGGGGVGPMEEPPSRISVKGQGTCSVLSNHGYYLLNVDRGLINPAY